MDIVSICAMVSAGAAVAGVGVIYVKNGKSTAKLFGQLETKIDNQGDQIVAIDHKLDEASASRKEIHTELTDMKENCAGTRAGFDERIKTCERHVVKHE